MEVLLKVLEHGGHFTIEFLLIAAIVAIWKDRNATYKELRASEAGRLQDLKEQTKVTLKLTRVATRQAIEEDED